MKEVKIVIGKNFGDEGKGAAVDRLCCDKNALVVRHNGGAQAGHTVEEGDFRFVFHQLGSGSLRGCPAYWSRTFLPDLLKLGAEMEDFCSETERAGRASHNREDFLRKTCSQKRLGEFGSVPEACLLGDKSVIYAHPDCACVTVLDVLLNSLKEELRGEERHGSCGMGIYETVLRTRRKEYALYLRDFQGADTGRILWKLRNIRDQYTNERLKELREIYRDKYDDSKCRFWTQLIGDENVLYNAAADMVDNFRRYVILSDWHRLWPQFDTIVFENAQGLMLDWDNEEYAPNLTASYTGLRNVAGLLEEAGAFDIPIEIFYVTRTYVTRHGAGRLDYECPREEINGEMLDRTNLPNPWQGALRFARHPAGEDFFRYIRRDLAYLQGKYSVRVNLLLTHLDETKGKVLFSDQDRSPGELVQYCRELAPGICDCVLWDSGG